MSLPDKLIVRVPATSANLGPGFDVLGLALELHNTFTVIPSDQTGIEISGYGNSLPHDDSNLFCRSFAHLFKLAGRPDPPVLVKMRLDIPPARGLGSSATAVVGGLIAANAFLSDQFTERQLLAEAVKLERGGHADNVAPALTGGLVVIVSDEKNVVCLEVPFPEDLKAVLLIPEFEMDTVMGRSMMPYGYSRNDVVFNTGRIALFLAALAQRRYDLLRTAMDDRIHQPYRAQLFPQFPAILEAALESGARGACLSGGGSSVLALADSNFDQISSALTSVAKSGGLTAQVKVLDISRTGAHIVTSEETL